MTFVKGTKYLVKYQIKGVHRKPRYFVGVYLGINQVTGCLAFSLRPASGTSEVNPECILTYTESVQPCGLKGTS